MTRQFTSQVRDGQGSPYPRKSNWIFTDAQVTGYGGWSVLWAASQRLLGAVAASVVDHEVAARGYVPVFVDGTAVERTPQADRHAAWL